MVEQQFFFIYILMAVEIWDLNTAERCARLPAVSSNGSVNDSARSRGMVVIYTVFELAIASLLPESPLGRVFCGLLGKTEAGKVE
ncbi:Protein DECREASED SIZE EXCLUSION LIMIT 1 [Bienertia sinuspersici]